MSAKKKPTEGWLSAQIASSVAKRETMPPEKREIIERKYEVSSKPQTEKKS